MLLDVSPDQSMVDEGLAREVINRIQKLRKKVLDDLDLDLVVIKQFFSWFYKTTVNVARYYF